MDDRTDLSIGQLRAIYRKGSATPTDVVSDLHRRTLEDDNMCYIAHTPLEDLQARCRELEAMPAAERAELPLWGVPFAVKDNIDVQGFKTTAACPEFAKETASRSAPVVQALLDAGGIMLGKTNMDQFAAGLVGTRSPYGTAKNAFDERFVPGGSSSGSGAIVGRGLATFALGTDTAGSGRVPAMLNGCVGIKPTVGMLSTQGTIPACRSLDCVSCFARNVEDAATVVRIMQRSGKSTDATLRFPPGEGGGGGGPGAAASGTTTSTVNGLARHGFKFGVPGPKFLEFDGPGGPELAELYEGGFTQAVERMKGLGGTEVDVDFGPFCQVAGMLYTSAFLAERYSGIQSFLEAPKGGKTTRETVQHDPRLERVTGEIIGSACNYTAHDLFHAFAKLDELRCLCKAEMQKVDVLLVPTVLQHFLVAEVEAEEKQVEPPTWRKNALNGRFTNFVNLLDMAAISVPSATIQHPAMPAEGCDPDHALRRAILGESTCPPTPVLPLGVTLIGAAWSDEWLWSIGKDMHSHAGSCCGPPGNPVSQSVTSLARSSKQPGS